MPIVLSTSQAFYTSGVVSQSSSKHALMDYQCSISNELTACIIVCGPQVTTNFIMSIFFVVKLTQGVNSPSTCASKRSIHTITSIDVNLSINMLVYSVDSLSMYRFYS